MLYPAEMTVGLPFPLFVLGVFGLIATACASVPGTPGGPLQRAGAVQLSETQQLYDLSRIQLATTVGSEQGFHADAGTTWVFPARLGGRVAITDWLDTAADWGVSDMGGELRVGVPEGAHPFPFAVLIGARTDRLAVFPAGDYRGQHAIRARLEAYPALSSPSATSLARFHGVLALGASHGRYFHAFVVGDYDPSLTRDEDRVEGALGAELRRGRFVGSLIALPYFVARSSAPTAVDCRFPECRLVRQEDLLGYQQDFGVTITLNLGIALNARR